MTKEYTMKNYGRLRTKTQPSKNIKKTISKQEMSKRRRRLNSMEDKLNKVVSYSFDVLKDPLGVIGHQLRSEIAELKRWRRNQQR